MDDPPSLAEASDRKTGSGAASGTANQTGLFATLIRPAIIERLSSNRGVHGTTRQFQVFVDHWSRTDNQISIGGRAWHETKRIRRAALHWRTAKHMEVYNLEAGQRRPDTDEPFGHPDANHIGFKGDVRLSGVAATGQVILRFHLDDGETIRAALNGRALRRPFRRNLRTSPRLIAALEAPMLGGLDDVGGPGALPERFKASVDKAHLTGRTLTVLGWAFDEARAITAVEVCVETRSGATHALPVGFGFARRDVGGAFKGCCAATSGFSGTVVLPLVVPRALYLRFAFEDGNDARIAMNHRALWLRAMRTWLCALPAWPPIIRLCSVRWPGRPAGRRVVVNVTSDQSDGDGASLFHVFIERAAHQGDRILVRGWAFHETTPVACAALVIGRGPGRAVLPVSYGTGREDVCLKYGFDTAARSGFQANGAFVADGGHEPALVYSLETGEEITVTLDHHAFETGSAPFWLRFLKESVRLFTRRRRHVLLALGRMAVRGRVSGLATFFAVFADHLRTATETRLSQSLSEAVAPFTATPRLPADLPEEVDIIIPVYNGMDYLPALLDSVLNRTTGAYRLIVIDDGSPDERVWPFLNERLAGREQVILLQNEVNLGFVGTVNRAAGYTRNHIALLNADIEVPPDWLQRLMAPIFQRPRVASTTPFTNAATICSFPNINTDQEPFAGLDVTTIDAQFRSVDAERVNIHMPTGIGFCMGINKDVISRIGMFDAKTFGRGYGEENDWCMRARALGYHDLLVPDLYIYHKHGASFGDELKRRLQRENSRKLVMRHPTYPYLVERYARLDPPAHIRAFLVLLLSARTAEHAPLLIVDHTIGGGANAYRQAMVQDTLSDGKRAVMMLTFNSTLAEMSLHVQYRDYQTEFRVDKAEDLVALGDFVPLSEIVYNNLVSFDRPTVVLDAVCQLKVRTGARMTMAIHDYFPICPSFNLLDVAGSFCGIPDVNTCRTCLPANRFAPAPARGDIEDWRAAWQRAFTLAERVQCFSHSSQELIRHAYDIPAAKIRVTPHESAFRPTFLPHPDHSGDLHIGIVGTIDYRKGRDIVAAMALRIDAEELPVRITVIGVLVEPPDVGCLAVTGPYRVNDLPAMVEQHGINLCLLPSVLPETFSYVTEELMRLQMPLCCFDLGAPAERTRRYEAGRVLPVMDALAALDAMRAYHEELKRKARPGTGTGTDT